MIDTRVTGSACGTESATRLCPVSCTAIRSFSEILRSGELEPERTRHFLSIIHEESQRLTRLLDEILDINRLEAGSGDFAVEPVEVDRAVARVVETTRARYGRIHGIVNNAAIGPLGTVMETDPAIWDRIMAVNLRGPFLMARAVLPHFAAHGGGCIVNVGSGAGWGKPDMAAYATSKGGIIALSAAMALDHFYDRVRVNTVIPGGGGIVAGMSLGRVGGDMSRLGPGAVGTVAGRVANGTDLGNTIAWLMSAEAEAVSGTIIDVGCFAHQGSSTPLKRLQSQEKING